MKLSGCCGVRDERGSSRKGQQHFRIKICVSEQRYEAAVEPRGEWLRKRHHTRGDGGGQCHQQLCHVHDLGIRHTRRPKNRHDRDRVGGTGLGISDLSHAKEERHCLARLALKMSSATGQPARWIRRSRVAQAVHRTIDKSPRCGGGRRRSASSITTTPAAAGREKHAYSDRQRCF